MAKPRKDLSDVTVETVEKMLGTKKDAPALRNPNGRKTRSDKKVEIRPMEKPRKIRSDATVKAVEKRLGTKKDAPAIRNPDGRKTRSDKKVKTIREGK